MTIKKTMKKSTMRVQRNVGEMARQLIAKGTPLKYVIESIINSLEEYPPGEDYDANEPLVELMLEHGKFFRTKDNAGGFNEVDVKGFLDYFNSKKRGDKTKTGKIGSGRTFAFSFCKGIEVWSRSKDFPNFVHFVLREEDLTGNVEVDVDIEMNCEPPPFWDLEGTGTIISLIDVNWKRFPPAEKLGQDLSFAMSKFVSEVVRLNGKRLPERRHAKDPLRDAEVYEHLGGLCRYDLYIPAQGKEREIKLGGSIMPILDLKTFLKGMDPGLVAKLPEVLTQGVVAGDILIPGLNAYRNQDSDTLNPSVYDQFALDVFALLMRIGVGAEEYFATHEAEEKQKAQFAILHELALRANKAQGIKAEPITCGGNPTIRKGPRPANRPPFLVTPRDLAIVRGTSVTTSIQGYARTSGSFGCRVEPPNAQCVTVSQEGTTEFLVTGESEGDAVLVYFDAKDTSKEVRSSVKVVKKTGLQLTPLSGTIVQGGSGRAAIAHPEQLKKDQNPKYSVKGAPAGSLRTLSRARGGRRSVGIEVLPSCPPGTYTIVAEIPGTTLKAECTRTVVENELDDMVTPVVFEGSYYHVLPALYAQDVLAQPMDAKWQDKLAQPVREIRVWMGHPILANAKNGARDLLLNDAIINAHLDAVEADSRERMSRYDKLRTALFIGMDPSK